MSESLNGRAEVTEGADAEVRAEAPLPHALRSVGEVAWVDEVPDDIARLWVPIVSPKSCRAPLTGIVASTRAVACWTHWFGTRTGPCLRPSSHCERCEVGAAKRLYGYLGVVIPRQRFALLELTADCLRVHPELLGRGSSLRGCRFEAKRLGERRESRVSVTFQAATPQTRAAVEGWEADADLRPLLARVWGMRG